MDTGISRFVQEDDYRGSYTNPASMNRYVFTECNPIMGIDPSGYDTLGDYSYQLYREWQSKLSIYEEAIKNGSTNADSLGKEVIAAYKEYLFNDIIYLSNELEKISDQNSAEWNALNGLQSEQMILFENTFGSFEDEFKRRYNSKEDEPESETPDNESLKDLVESASLCDITTKWKDESGDDISKYRDYWWDEKMEYLLFPLYVEDYGSDEYLHKGQKFSANRYDENNNLVRHHAGIDLDVDAGTSVISMASGVVKDIQEGFYFNTWAVVIESTDGTTIRYAEIEPNAKILAAFNSGQDVFVKQGQVIGQVMDAIDPDDPDNITSMLHLEIYATNKSKYDFAGSDELTRSSNITYRFLPDNLENGKEALYFRREDLLNPTRAMDLTRWNKPQD